MLLLSKRNRNVLVLTLLMLGVLVGYQNCSSGGKAAFSSINTGVVGFDYLVGGISSRRFVGDNERFELRAPGNRELPQNIQWSLTLPNGISVNGSQGSGDPAHVFSYVYIMDGEHNYNLSFTVEGRTVNYSFTVQVDPRPGTCTDPNGSSLQIGGPANLNPGVTAAYDIRIDNNCYEIVNDPANPLLNSIVWDVFEGNVDRFNGDGRVGPLFTFQFVNASTYKVVAEMFVKRQGGAPTKVNLEKFVTVGGANGNCNDLSEVTLSQSGRTIGQPIDLNLTFPTCFNQSQLQPLQWDINTQKLVDSDNDGDLEQVFEFSNAGTSVQYSFNIDNDQLIPTADASRFLTNVQVIIDVLTNPNSQIPTRHIKNYTISLNGGSNSDDDCAFQDADVEIEPQRMGAGSQTYAIKLKFDIDNDGQIDEAPPASSTFGITYYVYDKGDPNPIHIETKDSEDESEYFFMHQFNSQGEKIIKVELVYVTLAGVEPVPLSVSNIKDGGRIIQVEGSPTRNGLTQSHCGRIIKTHPFSIDSYDLTCANLQDDATSINELLNMYKILTPSQLPKIPDGFDNASTMVYHNLSHLPLNANFNKEKITKATYDVSKFNLEARGYVPVTAAPVTLERIKGEDPSEISFHCNNDFECRGEAIYKYAVTTDYVDGALTCPNLNKSGTYIVYDPNIKNGCNIQGTLKKYDIICAGDLRIRVDPYYECRDANDNKLSLSCCLEVDIDMPSGYKPPFLPVEISEPTGPECSTRGGGTACNNGPYDLCPNRLSDCPRRTPALCLDGRNNPALDVCCNSLK